MGQPRSKAALTCARKRAFLNESHVMDKQKRNLASFDNAYRVAAQMGEDHDANNDSADYAVINTGDPEQPFRVERTPSSALNLIVQFRKG